MAVRTEGTPCWVDAQLPDLEAGKRFYGELFGWTFDPDRDEALLRGRRVAGLVPKRDGRMPTTWTVYLATENAGTLAARIRAADGRMVMDPYPVGPFGVLALAADPGGAVFGLRQAGDDDGFAAVNEPGAFCWMEVYTRRPDAVDTFYATVFGYLGRQADPEEEGAGPGPDYRVWSPPAPGPATTAPSAAGPSSPTTSPPRCPATSSSTSAWTTATGPATPPSGSAAGSSPRPATPRTAASPSSATTRAPSSRCSRNRRTAPAPHRRADPAPHRRTDPAPHRNRAIRTDKPGAVPPGPPRTGPPP